jgi:hypothetical protein
MRYFLIAALSATAICGSAATASAQETVTGAPNHRGIRSFLGHRLRPSRHDLLAFCGPI